MIEKGEIWFYEQELREANSLKLAKGKSGGPVVLRVQPAHVRNQRLKTDSSEPSNRRSSRTVSSGATVKN